MKITKIAVTLLFLALIYFAASYAIRTFYPLKYYPLISEAAEKYGLELSFVCALIHTESRFDANAVSGKSASGLMQLTKPTADWGAEEIGIKNYSYENILTPDINIELGCWYISKLIDQYGDENTALAAYNGGSGNVDRWLEDKKTSPDGKTLQNVPFKETQTFVERVGKSKKIYKYLLEFKNYIY
jgi:soluble lytic murein transglycosylase